MPSRVAKGKGQPKKAVPKAQASPHDTNLMLLWACLRNNGGGSVNWEEVSSSLGITPVAAKTRYHRLKQRMESMMQPAQASKKDESPELKPEPESDC
ncbi:uncharacterized protein N7482_006718 [Penicillium canariense]|uniref:Myb-like DNA-binding domain-containing protein n=1 Tax=Penicillium canariense TaxID=189055 RepID=A0A9W9HWU9_9EURO|nr:uncharacterized protein N7482_006718 [Penicillium canariense]KAJ5159714.1 hypothetical protein N7482_006718 [Penicillium canariense]